MLEEQNYRIGTLESQLEARIESQAKGGRTKSEAKSEASRLNGLKGGRPKKIK